MPRAVPVDLRARPSVPFWLPYGNSKRCLSPGGGAPIGQLRVQLCPARHACTNTREEGQVSATATDSSVAELTSRRREMRRELARVRWWRRLAEARKELVIAQLACPDPLALSGTDSTFDALAADAPTSKELAATIWPAGTTATPGNLEGLASLDQRLSSYEARVSETLERVTAQMVQAMGDVHRNEVRRHAGKRSLGGGDA